MKCTEFSVCVNCDEMEKLVRFSQLLPTVEYFDFS